MRSSMCSVIGSTYDRGGPREVQPFFLSPFAPLTVQHNFSSGLIVSLN